LLTYTTRYLLEAHLYIHISHSILKAFRVLTNCASTEVALKAEAQRMQSISSEVESESGETNPYLSDIHKL